MKSLVVIVSILLLPCLLLAQSAINGEVGGPTGNGKQSNFSLTSGANVCPECRTLEQTFNREYAAYNRNAPGSSYDKLLDIGNKLNACYSKCISGLKVDAAYKKLEMQYNQAKAKIEKEIEAASKKAEQAKVTYNNAQPAHNKVLENEQAQNYNAIGKVVNSSTAKVDLESLEVESAKQEQKKKTFEMENGVPFQGQNMDLPNSKENKQTSNPKTPLNKTIPECRPCYENQQFIDLGDAYRFADGQIKLRSICVFDAPFEPSTQFVSICGYNTTGKDLEIDVTFVVHTTTGQDFRHTRHFSYVPYLADNSLNFGLSSPSSKVDGFDYSFTSKYGKIVGVRIEKFSYK
ncbi:hypothetical protein [Flavisolibacter tropicus]|uniref:Uncharacterized protein n=1 Tax=Flavisolibacter tropicus TaxID=1492898 RepID=A0A172TZW5_9BACT|nr:hypothetical protein [Flavisolibacter tropicus]ANE52323.1 hypothetical protein SY85_19360 [Flavisolibacter tropicus]